MNTVLQNRFDRGHAEDVRTTNIGECEQSLNFNITSEPYRMSPYLDTEVESISATPISTEEITDVVIANVSGTEYLIAAGGKSTSSQNLGFYNKNDLNTGWSSVQAETTRDYIKGTLIAYKSQAYAVDYNGSEYRLIRYNAASNAGVIGTIAYSDSVPVVCFIHPDDNNLYIIIGNVIAKYDGSSFSSGSGTTSLPTDTYATSATNYGGYLAIVVNPSIGAKKPICYLWGRDMTLNTFQGLIDLGEGYCPIVENIDNELLFVMSPTTDFASRIQNKIIIKKYNGATVETIKELNISSSEDVVLRIKAKLNNKLYFSTSLSKAVYELGRNKNGEWFVVQSRLIANGSNAILKGLSFIGDYAFMASTVSGNFVLRKTSGNSTTYASTSLYKTTINPSMSIFDRSRDKKLEYIQIMITGIVDGTLIFKFSVDGSSFVNVVSETTTSGELIYEASAQADGDPFLTGREFQFQIESTGGVKIKEYKYRYSNLN